MYFHVASFVVSIPQPCPFLELGSGLGGLVWFVVDEYCSKTTTAQACVGYVSLCHCIGARYTALILMRVNQSKTALYSLLCAHFFVQIKYGLTECNGYSEEEIGMNLQ